MTLGLWWMVHMCDSKIIFPTLYCMYWLIYIVVKIYGSPLGFRNFNLRCLHMTKVASGVFLSMRPIAKEHTTIQHRDKCCWDQSLGFAECVGTTSHHLATFFFFFFSKAIESLVAPDIFGVRRHAYFSGMQKPEGHAKLPLVENTSPRASVSQRNKHVSPHRCFCFVYLFSQNLTLTNTLYFLSSLEENILGEILNYNISF